MPDWTLNEATTDAAALAVTTEDELTAARSQLALLAESYGDLQAMYQEDAGWKKLGAEAGRFTNDGRKQIARLADLAATGNALIKRGVNLRIAYIWGQGVTVSVRDDGATGQDVNAVWQDFWDEPSNRRAFTSSEAQARYERKLATAGEAFWAFPTVPLTGRVRVRRIPPGEVVDRVCDPEDAETVWYYKRVWTAVTVDADGKRGTEDRVTFYPALGYYPPLRPKTWEGKTIRWDAPMRPVTVNVPDEDWRGVGDVLAAMPWAKMDKEFLEDLAVYMRALTKIVGQVTTRSGRAAAAARTAMAGAQTGPGGLPGPNGGQPPGWAVTDPGTTIAAVSKAGAQIDADSSQPFATRAAAALEVPVTMLLGDPGITGSRATAETLDQPTELTFGMRREVHAEFLRDVANYVIDMAVVAPAGPLQGSLARDGDRLVVTLPEGDDRTIEIDWPEFDSTPLNVLMAAIVAAAGLDVLPDLEIFKLAAKALKVEDIDELIDELTDDDGNFLSKSGAAAVAAIEAYRRGEDPADLL